MPPWNAAGTRVSSGSVTAAGSVSVRCPAVPFTVPQGIELSCPSRPDASRSDGPSSMPRQNDSSDTTLASCARARRRAAQVRNDVVRAGSDTAWPSAEACHAAARSGTRIRHDTPSTAKWWIVSSRRPARSGPASNHTACSKRPAAGSSRHSAASASCWIRARNALVIKSPTHPPAADTPRHPRRPNRQHREGPFAHRPHRAAAAAHRDDPAAPAALPTDAPAAAPPASAAASTG